MRTLLASAVSKYLVLRERGPIAQPSLNGADQTRGQMNIGNKEVVYTPANEPYLGRELLYQFDQLICSCLESNSRFAPQTHRLSLSDLQGAACQLIPQGISIALSIRE